MEQNSASLPAQSALACAEPRGLPVAESESVRLAREFRRLLLWLTEMGAREGLALKPFASEELPLFLALPCESQDRLVSSLSAYCEVMQETLAEEGNIVRNQNTLWRMLGRLGWRSSSDLYQNLKDDYVLEIYDANGFQLYRSFNFFQLCTYTLEQIFTVPWFELYERDDAMSQANLLIAKNVLEVPELGTRAMGMGDHDVFEKKRPFRRRTRIRPRVISPLYGRRGEVVGFVDSFSALSSVDVPSPGDV